MSKGKVMVILLIVGLMKKIYYKSVVDTFQLFLQLEMKLLVLSAYVTQEEFKNLTKVDTSDLALKTNVAEIKSRVDNIDVDKINSIDVLQGKQIVASNYLYFNQRYECFKEDETNPHKFLL